MLSPSTTKQWGKEDDQCSNNVGSDWLGERLYLCFINQ